MYVLYVWSKVHNTCMHTYIHTRMHKDIIHTHTSVCLMSYAAEGAVVCMLIVTLYIYIYIYIYMRWYVLYSCTYEHIHACEVCKRAYTHAYSHVHTRAYTHTYKHIHQVGSELRGIEIIVAVMAAHTDSPEV